MIINSALTEHVIRRIFSTNAQGSTAPLEASTLYRLWHETGLRRDDLDAGIRAMTQAGHLRTSYYAGRYVYMLTKKRAAVKEKTAESEFVGTPEADKILAEMAERVRRNYPVSMPNRRAGDIVKAPALPDRRRSSMNRIIALLPKTVVDRISQNAKKVQLLSGQILWESGDYLNYAYFPIDCIISLVHTMADGSCNGIAVVGNEGVVSISAALGSVTAPTRAMVLHAGAAYKVKVSALREEFERNEALQRLLLRYSQALLMQVAQTAACNRHHSVEQQLCRLLLTCADRLRTKHLSMTHEVMANMVGVRRVGITEAMGKLRREGMIAYERGSVTLVDERALSRRSCECYAVVRNEFEALRKSGPARVPGSVVIDGGPATSRSSVQDESPTKDAGDKP